MSIFSSLRLNAKFNIILASIFIAILVSNAIDDYLRQQSLILRDAIDYSRTMARQIIETRTYLSDVLKGEARTNPALIPQVAATQVALRISKDSKFTIRQVSLRYRNPHNSPDPYEAEELKTFAKGPAKEKHQVIKVNGHKVLRYMLPMIAEESCLECHGSYDAAPSYIQQRFPRGHFSYNYHVGEVIGAVSVSIPMAELYRAIGRNLLSDILFSGGLVFIIIILLGSLIRRTIINPVLSLSDSINQVTLTGSFNQRLPAATKDEIGQLISAFNAMMEELEQRTIQRQESEERYRNMIEMAQSAIVTFLGDGKIVIANRAAERLFGLPTSDLLGVSFYDFLIRGDQLHQEIDQRAAMDTAWSGEIVPCVFKDIRGHRTTVELALSATLSAGHRMFTVIIRETGDAQ